MREGDATKWTVSLCDEEGRIEDVGVVFRAPALVDQNPIHGQLVTHLARSERSELSVVIRPTRWGPHALPPVFVVGSSAWNGFRSISDQWDSTVPDLVALPQPAQFRSTVTAVRARGLVGENRSPHPGAGTEFASIRLFQAGDRLRRIHWGETLRTGQMHVTSTWSDQDRLVVLLIDAFDDVGESHGIGGSASSLDIALRSAAALAEHYIRTGNRVALTTMGAHGVRSVPAGAGRAHLRRLLHAMAQSVPSSGRFDIGLVPPGVRSDSLVVSLSPLLSEGSHVRLAKLVGVAHDVVAIDCLPPDIQDQYPGDPFDGIAWRIHRLERDHRISQIQAAGIAVVPWVGPGSLDRVLQTLVSRRTK